MKKIYDFIYCDGVLTRDVVFFLVKVGTSKKDQHALKFVSKISCSSDYYLRVHDNASMKFVQSCADSFCKGASTAILRRKMVEITWLASFLRRYPPCLLNSEKIC